MVIHRKENYSQFLYKLRHSQHSFLQFIRYGLVGTLGLLTDGFILLGLIHFVHFHPLTARPISFLCGNFITWWCNRHFTFASHHINTKISEWLRYLSISGLGALINLSVYMLLIVFAHGILALPVVALTIASIVAMVVNFFTSKHLVFS